MDRECAVLSRWFWFAVGQVAELMSHKALCCELETMVRVRQDNLNEMVVETVQVFGLYTPEPKGVLRVERKAGK